MLPNFYARLEILFEARICEMPVSHITHIVVLLLDELEE